MPSAAATEAAAQSPMRRRFLTEVTNIFKPESRSDDAANGITINRGK
jgi:hypothetical protein